VKIHYVAPHFYPDIGGVEDHLLRLGKYMIARGHEVTVHTSMESLSGLILPPQEDLQGLMVRRYKPGLRLGYYATTFKALIGVGDILHVHGYAFLPNDFAVRRYHGRMGTIFTTHHGVRMTPPNLRGRVLRSVYDIYGIRTLRRADRVFTSSKADRDWLLARKIPAMKLEVVPDGIDDESFVAGDKSVARRYGLHEYVLFLGRVHQEKCIDHLLKAVARLNRRELQIAVVGPDAGALGQLQQVAGSLGIASSVKFLGRVSDEDKSGLLAGCAMLVLPSLYEAQGLAILEAWAQGRPVVASRVGGVPEMVQDGLNGLLYDWGNIDQLTNSISKVLDSKELANRIGGLGRTTALGRYRWSDVASKIEQTYASVLAERPFRHKH